jgi:hypothetical protein
MVVPYTFGNKNEDILLRLERDTGYKNAISVINSALIDMGYSKTLDFRTWKQNIDEQDPITGDKTWYEKINGYIEKAPVDIIIETEVTWINPPGDSRNRQARLRLMAIDKYTSAIYADNGSIQSAQREFPDLATAVESALGRDGRAQFNKFLGQLDASYMNIMANGRQVSVRFSISNTNAELRFPELVGDERLSDKIEGFIRQKAVRHQYTVSESPSYMDFKVVVPVMDQDSVPQTPSWFLRRAMDSSFRTWGLDVNYSVYGNWINFTLLKRK